MAENKVIKEYLGYKLQLYDDKLQSFKPRPYDDADYYWVYTYDQNKWYGVYKGRIEIEFNNQSFESVIRQIEKLNSNIKSKMIHN